MDLAFVMKKDGPVRVNFQEWTLKIERRPGGEKAACSAHSFAKSANEWGTPRLCAPRA